MALMNQDFKTIEHRLLSAILVSLLISLLLSALRANSCFASDAGTITRKSDPVIIPGKELKMFLGEKTGNLRLYSYTGGRLAPVPYQFDERGEEGEYIFPFGPEASREETGLLDGNDELVFMARDLGGRSKASPEGASSRAEIEIADPLTGGRAWVYLFSFEDPPPRSDIDYVSITPGGDRVEAENFVMGFSDEAPIGFDFLAIKPAGGGRGENTVDRLKVRVEMIVRMINLRIRKNESDFESRLVAFIDGPVRVIRRTENRMFFFWKIASPSTTVDNVFYYNTFIFPTRVNVPFDIGTLAEEFNFRVSTDGNENQDGMIFINEHNTEGTVLDGHMSEKEKTLDLSPYKWSVVYGTKEGNTGAWINRLEFDDGVDAVPGLYYMDDIEALEPPENDPGQFGALGYDVGNMETVKKGYWHIISYMYNTPEYHPGDEKEFLDIIDHPLEVEVK